MRHRITLFGCLLATLSLAPACGEDCPPSSQGGNCDLASSVPDTSLDVKPLTLTSGCDYVPASACTGNPGFACTGGGGALHRYGYALIVDQQGWNKLAATWGTAGTCTPKGVPTDWSETFVLLATMRATEASAASASHSVRRHGSGKAHVVLDFDVTHQLGCGDCTQLVSLGLVIKSATQPAVCLKVASACR